MQSKSIYKGGRVAFLIGALLFSGVNLYAQSDAPLSSEATSVLLERTKEMLADNRSSELLPYLNEILLRVSGAADKESRDARAFCMYQVGVCQMQMEQYTEALKSLDLYLEEFPDHSSSASASMMMAECYAVQKDWSGAERYARKLIERKSLPDLRRLPVLKLLSEALFAQEKWADAVPVLRQAFELSKEPKERSSAALMLVTCFVKEKDFINFLKFLDYCDESVRQHAALNMALIEAGDQKFQEEDCANALVLYRAVLRQKERVALYEKQIVQLEAQLAKPYVETVGSSRRAYDKQQERRKADLLKKKEQLGAEKTGKSYDADLELRMGQSYDGMERKLPAYTFYRRLYTVYSADELAEAARFKAFLALVDMQKVDKATQEAEEYMRRYPKGKFVAEISLNQMQMYLQAGRIDEALAVGLNALQGLSNNQYKDQLQYLIGYAYFQKIEYAKALVLFQGVFENWPKGEYRESAEYWSAMCHLFLGDFAAATRAFQAYLRNDAYPERKFAEDVSYRMGVSLYGEGEYEASEKVFLRFVDTYPESDLKSEALSMLGDLRGAEGLLDDALGFYDQALQSATTIDQSNYATFQKAKTYELEGNHTKIIEMMVRYNETFGDVGNFSGASFWIGKSYKALGQNDQAMKTYLDAIVRFGDDLQNYDVDLILKELIKDSEESDIVGYQQALETQIVTEVQRAQAQSKITLALRLETLLAYIATDDARKKYIANILATWSLEKSGPLTLVLMANESAAAGNIKDVHRIYEHCMKHYADSEILADVMNLKLKALFDEGKYADVKVLAEEITNRFGYSVEIGLTRKLKGDAHRLLKEYDDAIKTYKELFAVRIWRGPLTPEALYWIGMCEYERGNYVEALAFFKRVFVLYANYGEWAAKAYEGNFFCLEKLGGRSDEIMASCQEMLANEAAAATPEGERALSRLDALLQQKGAK